ncbi:MAG: hypothetical protein J0I34_30125 [Pseudonocardia sp.]|uniref:hypothetical protein n=1 Tax=unclassified Pseudonocardia TaxID=2619320 RepID=UPI00086C7950|nr:MULTISPECIES: hypothetical protein [unclassified Pseudonocardia]MBN9113030.1 hypothetical protein [Pseudonocardia sp.]ODU28383.1 MAG: hypothetical protein ABS80_02590 [Pseudonocardia sp. SCN 72-51]ODV05506.1 MAG: hypothetical protein ABT15_16690 [Pseudonocardia sp. SCN 73-27]
MTVTVTVTGLTRAAGLAAAASGLLFGFVQFIHPAETVAAVTTTGWAVTHYLTLLMAVLGLAGTAGLYLSQARRVGVAGLVGWLAFSGFYLVTTAYTFVEAFVLPELAGTAPGVAAEILAIPGGGDTGDLGAVAMVGPASFALYLVGGVLLGITLFRARVLARWASALLAVGPVLTLAAPLVPHSLLRLAALPVAVALIGLGVSLWQGRPETTPVVDAPAVR